MDYPSTEIFRYIALAPLGTTSKPNRRLTGTVPSGTGRVRSVSIVQNNDNRREPDGTASQLAIGF